MFSSHIRRRVSIVWQHTPYECGAACLTMILRYYGCDVTLQKVRDHCGIGRDGVSALTLLKVAKLFGCAGHGYSTSLQGMKKAELPVILHWRFQHYVVLEKMKGSRYRIVDPARGKMWVNEEQLNVSFTGVILIINPPDSSEWKATAAWFRPQSALKAIYARLQMTPGVLAEILAISFVAQLAAIGMPLLAKLAIDSSVQRNATSSIAAIAVAVGLCLLLQLTAGLARNILLVSVRRRLNLALSFGFLSKLLRLPVSFVSNRAAGDLLLRLESSGHLRDSLANIFLGIIVDATFTVSYLVALFLLAPVFAFLTFALTIIYSSTSLFLTHLQKPLRYVELATRGKETGLAIEMLEQINTVKSLGAEKTLLRRWVTYLESALDAESARAYVSAIQEISQSTFRQGLPWILILVGCVMRNRLHLSLGSLFAVAAVALQVVSPFSGIVGSLQQLALMKPDFDRIDDIMQGEEEGAGPSEDNSLTNIQGGEIEFKGITFRYNRDSPAVLSDVSFRIPEGKSLGVVGASGSGKTTLLQLILGFHKATEGTITLDGLPIDCYNMQELRSQFGVVLQESAIFAGTVKSNIDFRGTGLAPEELSRIVRSAKLEQFLRSLPMKENTYLAYSSSISGGERQRIAIARALAGSPRILLLDEATSHLDSDTEAEIVGHLNALKATRIVIAHRLSTVRHCDEIIVIEKGRIVERGSHFDLMRRDGIYHHLFQMQASDPNQKEPEYIP